jgi:hypothetical protein
MADPQTPFGSTAPNLIDYMPQARQPSPGMVPGPSGTGGMLSSALGGGAREAMSQIGSAVKAGATMFGAPGVAQAAGDWAKQQQTLAAQNENPDWENTSAWSPSGLAYRVVKGLPSALPIMGASLAAPFLAGVAPATAAGGLLAGGVAGALSYPLAVGGNVQTQEKYTGEDVTRGEAAKSALLGVPEAAVGALPMERLLSSVAKPAVQAGWRGVAHAAAAQAGYQGAASAGQDAIAQQMGDPDRPIASRAQEMLETVLTGGATGALFGAGVHALAKKNPTNTTNADLLKATEEATQPPGAQKLLPPPAATDQMGAPKQITYDTWKTPENLLPAPGATDQLGAQRALPRPVGTDQMAMEGLPAPVEKPALANPVNPAALPAPAAAPEAHTAAGEPINMPGEPGVPPADVAIPQPGFALPTRPFADMPLERLLTGVRNEPDIQTARSMAYELYFRQKMQEAEASGTRQLPPTVAAVPIGNGMLLWPDGTVAPANKPPPPGPPVAPSGQAPLEVQFADGTRGPPNHPSPFDAGAISRVNAPTQPTEAAGPVAPAHPLAAAAPEEVKASTEQVVGKKLPWLDTTPKAAETPLEAAQQSVLAKLDATDGLPNKAVIAAGQHLGVLDEIGKPITEKPSAEAGLQPSVAAKVRAAEITKAAPPVSTNAETPSQTEQAAIPLSNPVKDTLGSLSRMTASANPRINAAFWKGIEEQKGLLNDFVTKAAKNGSVDKDIVLQSPTWDKQYEKFSPEAQRAIDAHQNAVENMINRTRTSLAMQDPNLFASLHAGGGVTQGDVDAAHVVAARGSARDGFQYIAQNGESGLFKTVAKMLADKGIDPKVQAGGDQSSEQFAGLHPGETADMAYDHTTDTVHVFPGVNDFTRNLLHEGIHSATVRGFDAGGLAAQEMQGHFDYMKAQSPNNEMYGMRNPKEFIAEAFTNETFRDFLRATPAPEGKISMWQAFKNTVAKLFGVQGSKATMLDRVMETGQRLMTEDAQLPRAGQGPMQASLRLKPAGLEQVTHDAVAASEQVRDKLSGLGDSLKVGAQKALLIARNGTDIANALAERFGVKSAQRFLGAAVLNDARLNTWSKADVVPLRGFDALPADRQARLSRVADATRIGIDARLTPDKLPVSVRQSPELMSEYAQAHREYMAASPEDKGAYEGLIAMNQGHRAFMLAQSLHNYVKDFKFDQKGLTEGFQNDLAHDRQFDNDSHNNPLVGRDKAVQELQQRLAGIRDYLDTDKSAKLDPERRVGLEQMHGIATGELRRIQSGVPYFRSGRTGDYFVSAQLPTGATGRLDQATLDKLRPVLDEYGLKVNPLLDNTKFYARMETREQAQRLHNAFAETLGKDAEIGSGLAEELKTGQRPTMLNEVIEAARQNAPDVEGLSPEEAERVNAAHERNITELTRQLMDVLPESAQAKISAERKDVQGYSKDIGVGLHQGAQAYGRLLANMSTVAEKGAALSAMRAEMTALKKDPDALIVHKEMAQNALNQLLIRDTQRPVGQPNGFIAATKGLSYLFELASPGYALTLLTQNATLGLPELGSRVGYAGAAKSIGRVSGDVIKALKGMMSDPDWTSAGMRVDSLQKAGLSKENAEFLVRADNRGKMTSSSFTPMLMDDPNKEQSGGWREKLAAYSTAYTRYCELQPRVQMALAAKDAWRGEKLDGPLDDFVDKVVDGSQFNYDPATMPRIMSRAGPLGELAPLMTQFWRFRTELTHKLYRSFEEGFTSARGTEWSDPERAQARSFLYGHLTAMTVLAGTLGLPMVGVLASVADKLADWATNDPTHDFIASYRSHLTDVFGAPVGEAIARGAPRFAGADFSHLGEGTIAPGISEALMAATEKRKFEDAEKDWLKRLAGAPVGMMSNMALGMRDIANGDYLRGLQKFAPEGLRGPVEVAQLAKYGYRDKSGMPLKINGQTLTPTAQDMLMQAIGVDPAKEAEYSEVRSVASGIEQRRQIQDQNITQHLVQAYERGDQNNFQYWSGQSALSQQEHPGLLPPLADFQRAIQMRSRASAIGLPPGVTPRDLGARGMIGYANSHE